MAEEQVVELLTEIRDLDKQRLVLQEQAIRNQQESLSIHREAVERSRKAVIRLQVYVGIIVFCIFMLFALLEMVRH